MIINVHHCYTRVYMTNIQFTWMADLVLRAGFVDYCLNKHYMGALAVTNSRIRFSIFFEHLFREG